MAKNVQLKEHRPAFNTRVQNKMTRPWIDSSKWPYWEKILCMGTADKFKVATFPIDETTILEIRVMIALTFWSRLTDKVRRVMTEKKPTKKSSLVALHHKAIFHMQARMCSKTGDWMKNSSTKAKTTGTHRRACSQTLYFIFRDRRARVWK